MAAKRKKSAAAKPAARKKSPAKAARKTVARKAKAPTKAPAKRKPGRPPKSAIEKAETAIVEMARGIVPKARKAIRSVTRKISGKK